MKEKEIKRENNFKRRYTEIKIEIK